MASAANFIKLQIIRNHLLIWVICFEKIFELIVNELVVEAMKQNYKGKEALILFYKGLYSHFPEQGGCI